MAAERAVGAGQSQVAPINHTWLAPHAPRTGDGVQCLCVLAASVCSPSAVPLGAPTPVLEWLLGWAVTMEPAGLLLWVSSVHVCCDQGHKEHGLWMRRVWGWIPALPLLAGCWSLWPCSSHFCLPQSWFPQQKRVFIPALNVCAKIKENKG